MHNVFAMFVSKMYNLFASRMYFPEPIAKHNGTKLIVLAFGMNFMYSFLSSSNTGLRIHFTGSSILIYFLGSCTHRYLAAFSVVTNGI